MALYRRIYYLLVLPVILLELAYILLVTNITHGNIIKALLEPWGTAIILMLISRIYLESIFTSPRYALVNSLNALLIGIILLDKPKFGSINFWIILIYSLLVFLSSILFFLFSNNFRKINFLIKFSERFGKATVIFPMVALIQFTQFGNLHNSLTIDFEYGPLIWLGLYYVFFLILTDPIVVDAIKNLPFRIFKILSPKKTGFIKATQSPNIVLAEFKTNSDIHIDDLVLIGKELKNSDGTLRKENDDKLAIVLDFIGMESDLDSISVRLYLVNEPQRNLSPVKSGLIKINSQCTIIENPVEFLAQLDNTKLNYYWNRREDVIGLVSSDSNINILRSDIIRQRELENAELVSIINENIKNPIRYQIIEAETQRETQTDKKDYGFTKLIAYQLGEWRKPEDSEGKEIRNKFHQFFEFPWTPQINSLVFKWNSTFDEIDKNEDEVDKNGYFLLGNIPKTGLPIYLRVKDLVSHHTAILGVTGSGKSTLVFKIIQEINKNSTLVICIDITGEYRSKLIDFELFFDEITRAKWAAEMIKLNEGRKRKELPFNNSQKITGEEFERIEKTCVDSMNQIVKERVIELRTLNKIVIFELFDISNTKISIDCTQYIIQGLLEYARDIYDANLLLVPGAKDNFQSCLVLEEAHTLVPENIGVGGRFSDSQVVIDKISQIALQGRKYNVGFILISQRTATVKKTVLNQCNTMISFRAYDETSFNFLSSYYGDEYVKEISHLKNDGNSRYIIASGKAVVADRPVIVELKEN